MNAYSYKMMLDEERLPLLVREKAYYKVDRRIRYDNPQMIMDLATEIGLNRMAE